MASKVPKSKIIGRTVCPECTFKSAHVRESEKCFYRFCPECGAPYHAKTERQKADLLAKTRLDASPTGTPTPTGEKTPESTPAPTPTGTPTGTAPMPTPTPTPPKAKASLFSF